MLDVLAILALALSIEVQRSEGAEACPTAQALLKRARSMSVHVDAAFAEGPPTTIVFERPVRSDRRGAGHAPERAAVARRASSSR
jgi:hypothetical protein